jgi:hypothetical protein
MITALMFVMKRTCRSIHQIAKQIWFLPRACKPAATAAAHANTLKRILKQKVSRDLQPLMSPATLISGAGNISGLCVHTSLAAQSRSEVP